MLPDIVEGIFMGNLVAYDFIMQHFCCNPCSKWTVSNMEILKIDTALHVMKMLTASVSLGLSSSGPVLCVVMSSNGEQCYSGGTDGLIHGWNTTNPNIDPYDSYGTLLLHVAEKW